MLKKSLLKPIAPSIRSATSDSDSALLPSWPRRKKHVSLSHEELRVFPTHNVGQDFSPNLRHLFPFLTVDRHASPLESDRSFTTEDNYKDPPCTDKSKDSTTDGSGVDSYEGDELIFDGNSASYASSDDYPNYTFDDYTSPSTEFSLKSADREESDDKAYFGHQESSGQFLNPHKTKQLRAYFSNFQQDHAERE